MRTAPLRLRERTGARRRLGDIARRARGRVRPPLRSGARGRRGRRRPRRSKTSESAARVPRGLRVSYIFIFKIFEYGEFKNKMLSYNINKINIPSISKRNNKCCQYHVARFHDCASVYFIKSTGMRKRMKTKNNRMFQAECDRTAREFV